MNRHLHSFYLRPLALLALLAMLCAASPASIAHAATTWYVAPTGTDTLDCRSPATACRTIAAAIAQTTSGDTIVLAAGSYDENLTIDRGVRLQGAGASRTTINGGARGPVIRVTAGPTFLTELTLTNGGSDPTTNEGGGIRSNAELTVDHIVVSGSQSNEAGGGIFNSGTLSIYRSTISNNLTPIYAGGIANNGTLALVDSTVRDNFSGRAAGGLWNQGTLTVFSSTISGNVAKHDYGGGILSDGTMTLTNVTVSGNSSGSSGDGVQSFGGVATLIASTVSANSGEGISVRLDGRVVLRQTNLAGNNVDCAGTLTSQGYNLIGKRDPLVCSVTPTSGDLIGGDPTPIDARLGALADNGGPTWTQALLPGSPAIDAVQFSACAVTNDQRGVSRVQGAGCDIGAYELDVNLSNILERFARANGPLGSQWYGPEGLGGYQIIDQRVDVLGGGPIYWKPDDFGTAQEAFVTLANVDPTGQEQNLLLKVQGNPPDWRRGAIEVLYDARANGGTGVVRVETVRPGHAWFGYQNIPVTLRDGDQLGARVFSDGALVIYRNAVPVGTVTLHATDQAFFNSKGGHIGLWFINAGRAWIDDFGGNR